MLSNLNASNISFEVYSKLHNNIFISPIKYNNDIVYATDDGVINIFDSKYNTPKRKIIINSLKQKELYDIKISEKYNLLFATGIINKGNKNQINVYDYNTGELIKEIQAHDNTIVSIDIDDKNDRFLSSSFDKSIKVWSLKDFSLLHTIKNKRYKFHTAVFVENNIAVVTDKLMHLYELNGKIKKRYLKTKPFDFIIYNNNNIYAYGKHYSTVSIFDKNLKLIDTIDPYSFYSIYSSYYESFRSRTGHHEVAKSNQFLINSLNIGLKDHLLVYDTSLKERKLICNEQIEPKYGKAIGLSILDDNRFIHTYSKIDHLVIKSLKDCSTLQVIRSTSPGPIYSLNNDGENLYIGNQTNKYSISEQFQRKLINGLGNMFTSVWESAKASNFGFSATQYTVNTNYEFYGKQNFTIGNYGKITKKFNLKDLSLIDYQDESIEDGSNLTGITCDGKECSINGYKNLKFKHNVTAATKISEGIYAIGLSNGEIEVINLKLNTAVPLDIHSDTVYSLIVKNNMLISGSMDQTIRFWDISDIDTNKFSKREPEYSLFIAQNNDWILWTKSGFFNTSNLDIQYAGWKIKDIEKQEFKYYTMPQLSKYLYKPEVVNKTVEYGSEKKAIVELSKQNSELKNLSLANLVELAPPDVNILKYTTTEKGIDFTLSFKTSKNRPEKLHVFNNTYLTNIIDISRLKDLEEFEVTVPYKSKKNKVVFSVENKWANLEKKIEIDYDIDIKLPKKDLYILAVGINKYDGTSFSNLVSAEKDALDISNTMSTNKIYNKIHINKLVSSEEAVTVQSIKEQLDKIKDKASHNDEILIFLAGHGVTNNKGYNYITQDTKIKNIDQFDIQNDSSRALKLVKKDKVKNVDTHEDKFFVEFKKDTTLTWKNINEYLKNIYGKKYLIVDTCEVGKVVKQKKYTTRSLEKEVLNTHSTIFTASSSQQYAQEHSSNGLFTSELIGQLKKEDNDVYFLNMIQNVQKGVFEKSNKTQLPTVSIPSYIDDYIFYKIK